MFYSVNLENLTFVHKHRSYRVVAGLVYLECSYCHCAITSLGSPNYLPALTFFELQKLYQNTCGQKFAGFEEKALRKALAYIADQLDETDCYLMELEAQFACVKFKDTQLYKYVKGASKPRVVHTLEDAALHCAPVSTIPADWTYKGDPALDVAHEAKPTRHPNERSIHREPKHVPPSLKRPTEGVAADIWALLDTNPSLNDPTTLKAEAENRKWNTLTAILQLSQWRKFNNL